MCLNLTAFVRLVPVTQELIVSQDYREFYLKVRPLEEKLKNILQEILKWLVGEKTQTPGDEFDREAQKARDEGRLIYEANGQPSFLASHKGEGERVIDIWAGPLRLQAHVWAQSDEDALQKLRSTSLYVRNGHEDVTVTEVSFDSQQEVSIEEGTVPWRVDFWMARGNRASFDSLKKWNDGRTS